MANRVEMAKVHSILTSSERGWSFRRIARELGVHRDTVARYVRLLIIAQASAEARFVTPKRSPNIFAIERTARPRVNRGDAPPLWYSTITVWSSPAGAPPRQ
jgi:IS30 family transposase